VALALLSLQIPLLGFRWWLALRALGEAVPLRVMVRVNTASNLMNFLLPGQFGEIAGSYWLARNGHARGVSAFGAVVGAKALGGVVNALAGGFVLLRIGAGEHAAAMAGVLLFLLGVPLALFGLSRPAAGRVGARLPGRLGAIWEALSESLRGLGARPSTSLALLLASILKLALHTLAFHAVLRALSVGSTWDLDPAILVAVVNELGRPLTLHIPLALGGQELLTFSGLAATGVAPATALAAALLWKAVTLLEKGISLGVVSALSAGRDGGAAPSALSPR
jgi:uncharacterized membrane protein YbhN (UPF0104 family)